MIWTFGLFKGPVVFIEHIEVEFELVLHGFLEGFALVLMLDGVYGVLLLRLPVKVPHSQSINRVDN
jgi:hypothetical protein